MNNGLHLNSSESEAIAFSNSRSKPLVALAECGKTITVAGSPIKLQSYILKRSLHPHTRDQLTERQILNDKSFVHVPASQISSSMPHRSLPAYDVLNEAPDYSCYKLTEQPIPNNKSLFTFLPARTIKNVENEHGRDQPGCSAFETGLIRAGVLRRYTKSVEQPAR